MNKEKVQRILDVFDQMYPDAKCVSLYIKMN